MGVTLAQVFLIHPLKDGSPSLTQQPTVSFLKRMLASCLFRGHRDLALLPRVTPCRGLDTCTVQCPHSVDTVGQ